MAVTGDKGGALTEKGEPADAQRRLANERRHARAILESSEANWGWRTPAGALRRQRRSSWLAGVAPLLPSGPGRVVEIGAGTGTFTADLAASLGSVTAVDISETLLAEAKRRQLGASLVCMNADDLAFAADQVAAVVGCSVLHHLDWDSALQSCWRVLQPGGVVRFCEPNLANPQIWLQKKVAWLKKRMGDSPDERAFTAQQIHRSLSRAGFTEIDVRAFEFLHPSTPRVLIGLVSRIERLLSGSPLRSIAGSLLIQARKPKGGALRT